MQQEWLKDILFVIENCKEDVPEGCLILKDADSMEAEQLLSSLNKLFELEEKAIKNENSKPFVTDTYENKVKHFATQLVMSMVSNHEHLKGYESYRKLLGQRHVAYGFYSSLENGFIKNIEEYQNILKDQYFEKPLYLGLVNFYQNFYGRFSDNEEAIKLLCKFYPKDVDLSRNIDEIVSAVFRHITNAGTPTDFGFAYNGIELISKHIGNLPIEIINKLLQKYELFRIINEKIYRHQIITIIMNSIIDQNEKPIYKFNYLDSLLLANNMNRGLYKKYGEHNSSFVPHYLNLHTDLSVKNIELITHPTSNENYAYWTNGCSDVRQFVIDGEVIINISLNTDIKEICINYAKKPNIKEIFNFTYTDWMLNDYHSKEVEQRLEDFVFEVRIGDNEIVYNNLIFSLVYLNNYRGVSEQLIDFDHKFTFDKTVNELRESSLLSPVIPHFYGKNIHSLSCIVGKNGAGKTSTMDFIRNTFFKLLRL